MRGLAMAFLLTGSATAYADPKTDAQAALERGIAAYRARDLDAAHAELVHATELSPDSPNPYRWLAIVERDQGECRAALVHVESFLARVPQGDPRIPEVVDVRNTCVVTLTAEKHVDPVVTPPPPPAQTSRWWLWPAIGVAGATVIGIVAYLVLADDDPAQLAPITCTTTGCS